MVTPVEHPLSQQAHSRMTVRVIALDAVGIRDRVALPGFAKENELTKISGRRFERGFEIQDEKLSSTYVSEGVNN